MRIAHLGSKGIPAMGGTERVVEAISRRQAHHHAVVVYGSSRQCVSGRIDGVAVVAVPTFAGKYSGPVSLQLFAALQTLVCRRGFDLVHLHGSENAFVAPLLRLRYPVVTTSHGPAYQREKWPLLARLLIRRVEALAVTCASQATAVARNQADLLTRRYGRVVMHIPNGVDRLESDDEAAQEMLERNGLAAGEFILFAAARVDPTKGCHTLLEALAKLHDPPATLVLGDLHHAAGYEQRLRDLAEVGPLRGKVVFAPRTERRELLAGLIQSARLFVFPSTVEAMSMMLLEALSLGAPVLASDIPENMAVVPTDARTFRAGDAIDLRAQMEELLATDTDDLLASAARHAAEVRARFAWDGIVAEYERVYERAVGHP